jgi:hypothetical protein
MDKKEFAIPLYHFAIFDQQIEETPEEAALMPSLGVRVHVQP